jgi:four helix bundle protein
MEGEVKFTKFEDIDSWKEARVLTNSVYTVSGQSRFSKDYGLRDQIQRASVSIMANIAEGFDAGTDKGFVNFLNFAYRSASEVQSLLYVALDQKYVPETCFREDYDQAVKVKRLIGGLIKYLKSS